VLADVPARRQYMGAEGPSPQRTRDRSEISVTVSSSFAGLCAFRPRWPYDAQSAFFQEKSYSLLANLSGRSQQSTEQRLARSPVLCAGPQLRAPRWVASR